MIRTLLLATLLLGVVACRDTAPDLMSKARMAAYEKRPQDALGLYRSALDLIEKSPTPESEVLKARALRGAADVYHYELQDLRQAVAVYRELLAQCPEAPETLEARVILADILQMRFNDIRGAITELTAALQRNPPQSAELHYRVAKLYFQLQDYPQCELEAQRVATRYETSGYVDDALLLRAQALAMIEPRRPEAVRVLEDIVHRFPDSGLAPHALFELGKLRDEAGEDEAAIVYWVEALASHPQPQVVQSQITRVRERILKTTPRGLGNRMVALDRNPPPAAPPVRVNHSSSDDAMGVRANLRLKDSDGERVDDSAPVAPASASAPPVTRVAGGGSTAVAPAVVAPAAVTPAVVTPAVVTPAAVTPAAVTPVVRSPAPKPSPADSAALAAPPLALVKPVPSVVAAEKPAPVAPVKPAPAAVAAEKPAPAAPVKAAPAADAAQKPTAVAEPKAAETP
ncbi:MAG: tetratricopeptide repeat protein [Myxococcota bacterium]|nr:tetratricopeptide repeat protein [Myxococcota bacterium]